MSLLTTGTLYGFGEQEVLRLAAALERGSEHPLAAAVLAGAAERSVEPAAADGFESVSGKGVRGRGRAGPSRLGTGR